MLRDANAFSGFAVDAVPRAKEFYATTLGPGNILSIIEE
jgi:hypothetical protein